MTDSQSARTRPPAVAPGHVAVITGGASGIGLAVAEALIAEQMSVVLADIDAPKLRGVDARLSEDGASVTTMVCNTTAEAEVNSLIEFALERFGAVHVMFNNAGIAGVGDAWTDPIELWRRVLDVNVLGVVHGIRAALPVMQQQGVGHIVSTASHAGLNGAPGIAPYVASKHAVVGLSESLFLELELMGSPVGASVLCPEFVQTDLMGKDKEPEVVDSPMAQFINQALAAGVAGGISASEVAAAVVAAIKADRFWILTHDSTREASVARVQRAVDGVNPPINLPIDDPAAASES
jgi:NAD(P)-dependent dehydrogenase (short-subunit alcohol dehydrogenase family)